MIDRDTSPRLADFAEVIASFKGDDFLADPDMRSRLRLSATQVGRGGKRLLEVLYAPFEHIEMGAELAIVGITPGAYQANVALASARSSLRSGLGHADAARIAKRAASFSGSMRSNLLGMLEVAGVCRWLGINDVAQIFTSASHRVHFTSALRNPVFLSGKDYNGQIPIMRSAELRRTVETTLADEVQSLPGAYWLPLWDKPDEALRHLVAKGILRADRLLSPMPHPAGGNGENIGWFRGTNRKQVFSSRRASTAELLFSRKAELCTFFQQPRQISLEPV